MYTADFGAGCGCGCDNNPLYPDWAYFLAQYRAILERVNKGEQDFEDLKKFVLDYFNGLDVKGEISDKIDSLIEDGTIPGIIDNLLKNDINSYPSSEKGWRTTVIRDTIMAAQGYVQKYTPETLVSGGVRIGYLGPNITQILPAPIDNAVITGSTDSYRGVLVNPRVLNKTTLVYRYLHFDADAYNKEITIRGNAMVTGNHLPLPVKPLYPFKPKREEVIAIADSYYRARLNGRNFAYGPNFVTYAASKAVNNAQGYGMMECDTLVAMTMMAIPYESSPYANDTPGYTYTFEDLQENPGGKTWALPWKFDTTLNRKVTYTGGQNWWLWTKGMTFQDNDFSKVEAGDIAIFRKSKSKYFDGITHIGIVNVEFRNGIRTPYLYHFTGLGGVESPMMYEPLTNVIERGGYTVANGELYFARPDYK